MRAEILDFIIRLPFQQNSNMMAMDFHFFLHFCWNSLINILRYKGDLSISQELESSIPFLCWFISKISFWCTASIFLPMSMTSAIENGITFRVVLFLHIVVGYQKSGGNSCFVLTHWNISLLLVREFMAHVPNCSSGGGGGGRRDSIHERRQLYLELLCKMDIRHSEGN